MLIRSYPKVNLALDILRKDESGYHEIRTVFHELAEPYDEITIETNIDGGLTPGAIEISCSNSRIPTDPTNTVWKAVQLLREQTGRKDGVKIHIQKNIPVMSGLGGGASNAVSVLKALGRKWKMEENALRALANQIGMDCAFFFDGGTALGEHFGEQITPLPPLPHGIKIEVIDTGVEISSRWAYGQVKIIQCGVNAEKTDRLINGLKRGDSIEILNNIHNDFETSLFEKFPQLRALKERIEKERGPGVRTVLAGSGGALVRISSL